jgi:hypothetical protein
MDLSILKFQRLTSNLNPIHPAMSGWTLPKHRLSLSFGLIPVCLIKLSFPVQLEIVCVVGKG